MSAALSPHAVLVSDKGGFLDILRDGEVLASVSIPPGRVMARDYLDLVPEGATLEPSEGIAAIEPRSLISSQNYGELAAHSGANPDFRPTSASRFEKEMRLMVGKMQANNRGLEAKLKALSSIDRIPQSPVIEPVAPASAAPDADKQ